MVTNPGYEAVTTALLQRAGKHRGTRLDLEVHEGPNAGSRVQTSESRVTIGSHPSNDLVVDDPSVSRFHCCLEHTREGVLVQDLDSRNGTYVNAVRIREGLLVNSKERIRVGESVILVRILERADTEAPADDRFGPVLGSSPPTRRMFRVLERVAATDVTVLLEGETGTGKSLIARAIHERSSRSGGPLIIVDCASLPPTLIESELFGHERGSFTGAQSQRPGAFEAARGGTLFLDEIGELPAELQPKFLRVIEDRMVKRIGANTCTPIDVRLIAATNRDLCREVRTGAFRRDLYYRLDVVRVRVPALRERREDIRRLAELFMNDFGHLPMSFAVEPEDWVAMTAAPWPGNIRELRAAIERSLVLGDKSFLCGGGDRSTLEPDLQAGATAAFDIDGSTPFREAKRQVIEAFEREFVRRLIAKTDGNVSAAARLARMDRNYLRTLITRYDEQG